MKRRSMLAGLAAAGVDLEAQTNSSAAESLYIPKPQLVEDRKLLHDFMDEFSFVDLVTSEPSLRITHIPVVLDRNAGRNGAIWGHISRQNPQTEAISTGRRAVIVFHGPHSYISPTWYATTEVVPTWNFASVHATGKLKPVTGEDAMRDLLARLIRKFEDKAGEQYGRGKIGGFLHLYIGEEACAVGAITGEKRKPHHIDPDLCIKCGACFDSCEFGAVLVS